MDPVIVYKIGFLAALSMAGLWSFIFEKNKPPSTKEFIAKLIARALLIAVLFTVLMGFCYLAFGMFRT